ncbi:putative permease [Rickettsia endosymbiont of Ixodes pacificus]|uniref:Rpn family recombination-promoting nuclease/putative transposase n=1 Tax=Rickettsia endosymbiont of Ixodes pacificus TaxID=1133329 RepID=UPI0005F84167|nr:Rpn family recombination-promoting nuclease/putative transposase [Rickettsia endosymbiont of Ixodes pacificus]AKS10424.1 PD-(D/E)XK nuclease family transposase [Rickettsia endosymbiont of Ixodes pacificus]KJW02645.1 putative permease [Rickettsia endosymbiont of Ixodes pacificus]
MERITPRVDLAFKKIFGVEENKDLLISLINSIVSKEDQIVDVTLLNPYNPQNFRNDKLSILDIKALGESGKRFNIEIQITDEADYDKRALYYWAKLYTEALQASQDYSSLNKAIGIHILNFTSIPETNKYHNVFHITEKDSGLLYFKDLELHTIELNKFSNNPNEELADILKKVGNSLDIWSAFLTRHDLLNSNNLPKKLDNASLKKALTVLDVMNFTSEERDAYEDHLKWLRIEANTLKKYEAQARVRGKVEGIQIGKTEEKIAIARNLKRSGVAITIISESTGLTKKQIEELDD